MVGRHGAHGESLVPPGDTMGYHGSPFGAHGDTMGAHEGPWENERIPWGPIGSPRESTMTSYLVVALGELMGTHGVAVEGHKKSIVAKSRSLRDPSGSPWAAREPMVAHGAQLGHMAFL